MRFVTIPGFSLTPASWAGVSSTLTKAEVANLSVPAEGTFLEVVSRLLDDGGKGVYGGYSMGGRLALAAALEAPQSVEALVLLSASPGIEPVEERLSRHRADEELAEWITDVGVAEFLDRWLSEPLFSKVNKDEAKRHRMEDPDVIAGQLRRLGQGAQPSFWGRLVELEMPVLVMAGSEDKRYSTLAERMVKGIGPNAHHVLVPDAGHALLVEAPAAVADAIESFIADLG